MSKPMFKNAQWAVTRYGLESRDRTYTIAAHRLAEPRMSDSTVYTFPLHMLEKEWCDWDSFMEAWFAAIEQHRRRLADRWDADVLAKTLRLALVERAQQAVR